MTRKLAFIAGATALAALVALPVLSRPLASRTSPPAPRATDALQQMASDDDEGRSWQIWRLGEDDDGDETTAAGPAPAGSGAPPANALFNANGAKPAVQVN